MKLTNVLSVAVVTAALALAAGCSQNEKASSCGGCGGGCAQKAPADAAKVAEIEQKTCPVTGESIDPAAFTEYKGKKVYFCCKGCIAKFEKDPEKYAAKIK
jgi:YHS domain-containing protein